MYVGQIAAGIPALLLAALVLLPWAAVIAVAAGVMLGAAVLADAAGAASTRMPARRRGGRSPE